VADLSSENEQRERWGERDSVPASFRGNTDLNWPHKLPDARSPLAVSSSMNLRRGSRKELARAKICVPRNLAQVLSDD